MATALLTLIIRNIPEMISSSLFPSLAVLPFPVNESVTKLLCTYVLFMVYMVLFKMYKIYKCVFLQLCIHQNEPRLALKPHVSLGRLVCVQSLNVKRPVTRPKHLQLFTCSKSMVEHGYS